MITSLPVQYAVSVRYLNSSIFLQLYLNTILEPRAAKEILLCSEHQVHIQDTRNKTKRGHLPRKPTLQPTATAQSEMTHFKSRAYDPACFIRHVRPRKHEISHASAFTRLPTQAAEEKRWTQEGATRLIILILLPLSGAPVLPLESGLGEDKNRHCHL